MFKKTLKIFLRNKLEEIKHYDYSDNVFFVFVVAIIAIIAYISGLSWIARKIGKNLHRSDDFQKALWVTFVLGTPLAITIAYQLRLFVRWIVSNWTKAVEEAEWAERNCSNCAYGTPSRCKLTITCYDREKWKKGA